MIPEKFNYELLVTIACIEFGIKDDEYYSSFSYGNIGQVRQTVCYLLRQMGLKNKEVSAVTGFSQSRTSNSVRIVSLDDIMLLKSEKIIYNYGIAK